MIDKILNPRVLGDLLSPTIYKSVAIQIPHKVGSQTLVENASFDGDRMYSACLKPRDR